MHRFSIQLSMISALVRTAHYITYDYITDNKLQDLLIHLLVASSSEQRMYSYPFCEYINLVFFSSKCLKSFVSY